MTFKVFSMNLLYFYGTCNISFDKTFLVFVLIEFISSDRTLNIFRKKASLSWFVLNSVKIDIWMVLLPPSRSSMMNFISWYTYSSSVDLSFQNKRNTIEVAFNPSRWSYCIVFSFSVWSFFTDTSNLIDFRTKMIVFLLACLAFQYYVY